MTHPSLSKINMSKENMFGEMIIKILNSYESLILFGLIIQRW